MKKWLPFVLIALVAVVAVGVGFYLYRTNLEPVANLTKEQAAAAARDAVHVRGYGKAPVTIEEFGDFECPPCGRLSEPLDKIAQSYPKKVKLVFREFPLSVHPHATAAAYAAEAAGLQGRFWEMHDLLYREQETWSKAPAPEGLFTGYAKMIGLNGTKFRADMTGEVVKARVAADVKRGKEVKVDVTPTVFVNGTAIHGPALSLRGLRADVEAALASMPDCRP